MIDPIQIPILMKAIDFVFDEGRKILEERRERRKMSTPEQESETPAPADEPSAVAMDSEKREEIKQDLLTSKIDEIQWKDHELEVQHLVRLLETHSRNYHIASEQYAKWGSALVPPIIVHNMTEAENSVAETLKKLETVLSKVYEKDITTDH
jgi:hypothetical protein